MHVLIPALTGLGNMVLMTPLLSSIKKNFPESRITIYAKEGRGIDEFCALHPHVDDVISSPSKGPYTHFIHHYLTTNLKVTLQFKCLNVSMKILYFSPSLRSFTAFIVAALGGVLREIDPRRHERFHYLEFMKCFSIPKSEWEIDPLLPQVKSLDELPESYIVIHLGVANNIPDSRLWPIDRWQSIITRLLDKGVSVVLVGDKNEEGLLEGLEMNRSQLINLVGKTSISQLCSVISNASLVVGVDSSVTHISGGYHRSTLVLFGPTSFKKSHQVGSKTEFIFLNKPCSPCRGPAHMGLLDGPESIRACKNDLSCMRDITVEMVWEKLVLMLSPTTL